MNASVVPEGETTANVGKIFSHQIVTNYFSFVNQGDKPVEIKNIVETCGCITGSSDKLSVKPSEKFTIKTVLNASSIKGSFMRRLWLITDDPASKKTLLTVTGNVQPFFIGIPEKPIKIFLEKENMSFTNTFTLTAIKTNFFLGKTPTTHKDLHMESKLAKSDTEAHTYTLTTILHPKTDKNIDTFITIPVSGGTDAIALYIPFKIMANVSLKIFPSKLVTAKMDAPLTRRFYINTCSKSLRIEKLNWEPHIEGLSIEIKKNKTKQNRSTIESSRCMCTLCASPDALKALGAMDSPGLTFRYPGHKPTKIDFVNLKLTRQ